MRNSGNKRYQYLFDGFSLYFPDQAARTVRWEVCDVAMIAALLDDGQTVTYDHLFKGIRYEVEDDGELNEEKWKREFARNLYRQMVYYPMTQEELAEKAGISQSSLSKYLNGIIIPSAYCIEVMARALECEPNDLTERKDYIIRD